MKDYDVELAALAKLLHQRHINPRMRVSRQACGPMSANAAGCGVASFAISKACRLSDCFQ